MAAADLPAPGAADPAGLGGAGHLSVSGLGRDGPAGGGAARSPGAARPRLHGRRPTSSGCPTSAACARAGGACAGLRLVHTHLNNEPLTQRRPHRPGAAAPGHGGGRRHEPRPASPRRSTRRTCCPANPTRSSERAPRSGPGPSWSRSRSMSSSSTSPELIRSLEEEFASVGRAAREAGPGLERACWSTCAPRRPRRQEEICLAELEALCRTAGVQVAQTVIAAPEPRRSALRRRPRQARGARAARPTSSAPSC